MEDFVRPAIKLVGVMVLSIVLHRCYRHVRGIEVCVSNVDSRALRSSVVVSHTGSTKSYPIGDLDPTDTACVWVKSDGEASIDVTVTSPTLGWKTFPLAGYVGRNTSGSISAELTADDARVSKSLGYYGF